MLDEVTLSDRTLGCLLGGACGDALGAPVEFNSLHEIHQSYGPHGIQGFSEVYGRVGGITDDTQLMLFTAEGLAEAFEAQKPPDSKAVLQSVHEALYRWRSTQLQPPVLPEEFRDHPGLIQEQEMLGAYAPGSTCMDYLEVRHPLGTFAINHSKGNGGIMRVAPVGIMFHRDPIAAYSMGRDVARLTHGHPTGSIAAGAFAMIISMIVSGKSLEQSIEGTLAFLMRVPNSRETVEAIVYAPYPTEVPPLRASFMGFGWVAEEALAIALHAVASTKTLEEAVIQAVNHDGDSDTTGSITGQLAGALYGQAAVPTVWVDNLLVRSAVHKMSTRLVKVVSLTTPI